MKPIILVSILASICAGALLASVVLSRCNQQDAPTLQVGKRSTIQFRRDALGAGAALPIPPMTGMFNGAETSISGTLKRSSSDWVVIEGRDGREILIPKSVILLIEQ